MTLAVSAITANVMEEQCQAYAAAGMDAWAPKPIDPRALLQAIDAVVVAAARAPANLPAIAPAKA